MVAHDGACHRRHQTNTAGGLRDGAEHGPSKRRMALLLEPGREMIGDGRKFEAGHSGRRWFMRSMNISRWHTARSSASLVAAGGLIPGPPDRHDCLSARIALSARCNRSFVCLLPALTRDAFYSGT